MQYVHLALLMCFAITKSLMISLDQSIELKVTLLLNSLYHITTFLGDKQIILKKIFQDMKTESHTELLKLDI